MSGKIVAIDWDETVVDVIPVWQRWCAAFFGEENVTNEYNLTKVYGEEAMTFWSTPFLYQKLTPRQDAVEYITKLHEAGYEIGFVTYCKKAHLSSKCKMIKRYFPFYKFIQATKEKGYTRCDFFIDDRHKYLNQQPNGVKLIKFDTPYVQDEVLEPKDKWIVKASNWKEIYEIIKTEEKT